MTAMKDDFLTAAMLNDRPMIDGILRRMVGVLPRLRDALHRHHVLLHHALHRHVRER